MLGWMAAHLLTAGDRGAENPLYNVDHLLGSAMACTLAFRTRGSGSSEGRASD